MNPPQYFYSLPIYSQSHPSYPCPPTIPYFIMMSPYYSSPSYPVLQPETEVINHQTASQEPFKNHLHQNQVEFSTLSSKSSNQNLQDDSKNSKNLKLQRLRDPKGRYYGIRKMSLKQKYKQNPKRNVITNIGNQLLAFASNKSKSMTLIKQIAPEWNQEDMDRYYEFVLNLRKSTDYYLNMVKMKQIWYPATASAEHIQSKNMVMLRGISYYYFTNMIHLFVLNSAKIKKASKIFHIKAIRALLKELTPRTQS